MLDEGEMNGGGGGGGEGEEEENSVAEMEVKANGKVKENGNEGKGKEKVMLMWGYLPGATPQRSLLLSPTKVRSPESFDGDAWKQSCGGGCGFAMAISEFGKLITWGSTDELGQSYLTSGKHEEIPEAFPLPNDARIAKAAAGGWAHCMAITDHAELYAWGWKECIPTGKGTGDQPPGGLPEKDASERQSSSSSDQVSPRSHVKTTSGAMPNSDNKGTEDNTKRRRLSSTKQVQESSIASEETLTSQPFLVSLGPGVKITAVAAGGRHTLALSDLGQVWGWGYGGEGQLGLGNRIRMVSSPHPVPCIESSLSDREDQLAPKRNVNSDGQAHKAAGSIVKAIACGGRHSAVITDTGALLTFGWGLYGQCGQGCTDDELSPTCVSSLLGIQIQGVAAGLWHTVCTSAEGDVYAFGGNQFGQLGTGTDQFETIPKLLDSPSVESKNAKMVACGARHSAIVTDDAKVFCWGWNKYGQLGLGDAIDRNSPTEVPLDGFYPKDVSCGWWHTLALAESPA